MAFQARHRWFVQRIADAFEIEDEAWLESALRAERNMQHLSAFFRADGPNVLFSHYRVREQSEAEAEAEAAGSDADSVIVHEAGAPSPSAAGAKGEAQLLLSSGHPLAMRGVTLYFMRVLDAEGNKGELDLGVGNDDLVTFGLLGEAPLRTIQAYMLGYFSPALSARPDWGRCDEEHRQEFMTGLDKFVAGVDDVLRSLHTGLQLRRPDRRMGVEHREFAELIADPDVVLHFVDLLDGWCRQTEAYLDDAEQLRWDASEAGPATELEYWRRRMQRLTSITEQLKTKDCKTVIMALTAVTKNQADPRIDRQAVFNLLRRWKQVDMNITEAANEAKDNVKYLATLDKFIEPLYHGAPDTIIDALPALMNSIKMIHTIARYYNTTERMTSLFMKITNQMITNCKQTLLGGMAPDRLWERDTKALLAGLESCLRLNEAYQEQYRLTKDKLLTMPKGKQFDFSEAQIFGKFDLFCRRVVKLIDMFSTIHQFQNLAQHKLEGMEPLIARFLAIIDEFKAKRHDLLDYHNNKFDRDFVEFNLRINDLEVGLQSFINASFESISSIEQSLALLKKFQAILQRESLRTDLDSKFILIFHNYGLELNAVQEIYERFKHSPPLPRNMPPVAGNIMWARHLLKRVEEPMKRFESSPKTLASKESKKIVKTFNKVARTLVAFEYLWYEAWCKSIESAKAGLQATLIIRHPHTGRLYVNFDPEILQLIREAKCLDRMGIAVPESAKMVLLQEDKFKSYYHELTYLLKEYDRVVGRISPVTTTLLQPHVADLEYKLRPGMLTLTWTSMNIDAYKHHVHLGLQRLEELVANVNDILENRIDKNLRLISKTLLVDLPADQAFSLEEFVAMQERHVRAKTELLRSKNMEVESAVEDVIGCITGYALDPHAGAVDAGEVAHMRRQYNSLMYQALCNCTKNSLNAIKRRVCARAGTGFLFLQRPFFEVDVQLAVPSVSLNPSIDDIQRTINKAALAVLRCTQTVWDWGQQDVGEAAARVPFFQRVGQDIEVVRVCLLLTGGIQGTRNQVNEYLASFHQYDWLWKEDMELAYRRFMQFEPGIDDFERELRRFVAVEEEITRIPPIHNIGALSLNTQNLKLQLRTECRQWKELYSGNVHNQARQRMAQLLEYMRATTGKLGRDVQTLDDLRFVMAVLREVRERESSIEMEILPILDMYQLLENYLPGGFVDKGEIDQRNVIRSSWRKLADFAEEVTDRLSGIQGHFKRQLMRDVKEFVADCKQFRADFLRYGPMAPGLKPAEAVEALRRFKGELEVRERKLEVYTAGEELFALRRTEYPELVMTRKELQLLDMLYGLYMDVVNTMEEWNAIPWADAAGSMAAMSERVAAFDVRCRQLPSRLRSWDAYVELRRQITEFMDVLPLLQELSKDSIKPRHWRQVTALTGRELPADPAAAGSGFRLRALLEANLVEHKEDIEEICDSADKQLAIEHKLADVEEKWGGREFTFAMWKTRKVPVLKGYGAVIEELEDSILALQTMLSMRHVGPFKDAVSRRFVQLSNAAETLESWVKVQLQWMSLESVFTGGDIAQQMPLEAKKFGKIDKEWARIMQKASETRGVVGCCGNELLKSTLPALHAELEKCQKSLEGYLEQKRAKFPRFYFVSNPVLLQILSQGSDPQSVQVYYEKIFDAIDRVVHDRRDKRRIVEMKSMSGRDEEVIPLARAVVAEGNIEDWLGDLEAEMQRTMKDICERAAADCAARPLRDFVDSYCGQFALLGIQLNWTADCEAALARCRSTRGVMADTNKKQLGVLAELSSWCLTDLGTAMNRTKVETLVTVQVHQREVFGELLKLHKERRLSDVSDFEWIKRARFYWRPDGADRLGRGACVIGICDAESRYQYEYLGCKERLVITPLTDRAYITLTQALHMHLGGAPAGPAGTGKTETVKDLGRALGIYVVVTNCTDQQRYTDMAKIFKGLCQAGLWGCFDEFNRIELPVLSVVAQQVLAITNAKRTGAATFAFPGDARPIPLKPSVGYFITMNPGYQGRQELPENLKALFRSVAMMVPDREIIMKVKLCSVGYSGFTALAKKFRTLYRLCEEQLSKQKHYDFGLRNILSVLRTAGKTKRDNPREDEEVLLYRTLRDMNLSKFVAQDVPLFLSLLRDLFPAVRDPPARQFPDVQRAVADVVLERKLVHHDSWLVKVVQLYETTLVRHGIMLVGPAGGGKSTVFTVLREALTRVTGVPHKEARMNPKAVRPEEMFGETDKASGEWLDGVFAAMWAKFNDRARRVVQWLICDGPVDALWIENLNTVLDDNKILTLANGDRIPMTDNVKLMFEVEDLRNASPATVSRAGIIYVSASDLDWAPVAEAWVAQQGEAVQDTLRVLLARYLGDNSPTEPGQAFRFVTRRCDPVMALPRVAMVAALLTLLAALLAEAAPALSSIPSTLEAQLERLFLYATAWSVGGLLEGGDRAKFDKYLRDRAAAAGAAPDVLPRAGAQGQTVFDFAIPAGTTAWQPVGAPAWECPEVEEGGDLARVLVPTADTARATLVLSRLHAAGRPVLLVGGAGTGKTATALMFFATLDAERAVVKKVNFSSATTAGMFQRTVEAELDKRGGKSFGPAGGRRMTLFLDDLSMPECNAWGDQPTLELVRQLVETGSMCFLDKDRRGDLKVVEDLAYVAAMQHPGGGRNDIPARLKRQFSVFNLAPPSSATMDDIFGQLVRARFEGELFARPVAELAEKLPALTIKLWAWCKRVFLPTPAKFHYVFNLRDLSRVFQGVLRTPREVLRADRALALLWRHECLRVFSDKLTTDADKARFRKQLDDVITQGMPKKVVGELRLRELAAAEGFFVDFMRDDEYDEDGVLVRAAPRVYELGGALPAIRAVAQRYLEQYNADRARQRMQLVLFDDALQHLIRISRILAMPRGNALLVGVGGSGKQSMARLAAFIARHEVFQITLTKSYGVNTLLEDLQGLYKAAGQQGRKITFLFTDSAIKDETFLEHLNNVLLTGEVPNLFPKDEMLIMAGELRSIASKERPGFVDTPDNLARFFIERVRENLHVVLCMSPMHPRFAERARKFPGIISGCTIDWFLPWPEEALMAVASAFVQDFNMECEPAVRQHLVAHMGSVHAATVALCEDYYRKMRRFVYQTPKSYLSFLDSFRALYTRKLAEVREKEGRVNLGLQKLIKGAQDVESMKVLLVRDEAKLREAEAATNQMLGHLEVSSLEAKKESDLVQQIRDVCEAEARGIAAEKEAAEEDLAKARPYLEEAERAVNSIQPADLIELKKLPKPSDIIKLVFDGVSILKMAQLARVEPARYVLGVGKTKRQVDFIKDSFAIAKAGIIADANFLKSLFYFSQFEKDNINEETIELLAPYLDLPEFIPRVARNGSKAAEGLCAWVRAMVHYHEASKIVKPKLEALKVAESKLERAEAELAAAEGKLERCKAVLDRLQADFEAQMSEKTRIAANADATRRRMEQATALINGLAGERQRWTADSRQFAATKRRLVGDCALACAFVSYAGPLNQEFRDMLVTQRFKRDLVHRGVPVTEELDLTSFLTDQGTVGDWNMQGLPTDPLSTQNGILVTRSSRFPLLVDPQGQGLAWIRNKEAERMPSFGATQLGHPKLREQLEFCMAEGKALIITGVENELDPVLDPVLEKQVVHRAKTKFIAVADKLCELHDDFMLYLTTRLPNPRFSPELQARTTVVDFAVTQKGLEEQLLGVVIQKEQASLEEQLHSVMHQVTSNTKALVHLDALLLERLTENEGNLLDDTQLISVLADTKRKATEVNDKLQSAAETRNAINVKREQFRPAATRGSVLYFSIVDMSSVNCMYQTSLDQFLRLFLKSIDIAERAPIAAKRVDRIVATMTYLVFRFVNRGLYERHRLSFLLILALQILRAADRVSLHDVQALLKCGAGMDAATARAKPLGWLPMTAWLNVQYLSREVEFFKRLPEDLVKGESVWRRWLEDNESEKQPIPDYEARLADQREAGHYLRLLLVRALREDRTILAVLDFVRALESVEAPGGGGGARLSALGPRFVEPVTDTLESLYEEMDAGTPVLFLLSPGADPTEGIEALAKKRKQPLLSVSMGEGQDVVARKAIDAASVSGSWVLLQNGHLDLAFMEQLDSLLARVVAEGSESDSFRLFITADPHPEFPIALLQRSVKVTNEPPSGLRANMIRAYTVMVDQDRLERVENEKWRQLVFSLCFLHTTALERRKFGPLGWSVPYEFNNSDLAAALTFLERHMYAGALSWPMLQYMVAEVHYGGRITDDLDRRLFATYAQAWLTPGTLAPNFTFNPDHPVARIPGDFVYNIPDGLEIDVYRNFVQSFPEVDSPEVFGLHPNADLTFRVKEVNGMLATILDTLPKENVGLGGKTREELVMEKASEMLGKLPADYVNEDFEARISVMGGLGVPLNIFLYQEVQRMKKVLKSTRGTLSTLMQAIRGEVVMTAPLQDALDAIVNAKPPRVWMYNANGEETSWISGSLGVWFAGLQDRDAQLRRWLEEGRPSAFWLEGFFNPQGFLTAMRQEVTRLHKADRWSLDDVTYHAEVTDFERVEQVRASPKEGVFIHGLHLDGASWNKAEATLAECVPKTLFARLPVLYVTAITLTQKRNKSGDYGPYGGYECPCYKYPSRTDKNLIFTVTMPSRDHRPSHWTLRGTALLCSTEL